MKWHNDIMRGYSPYKRIEDNLQCIVDTFHTLPSELKDKIAQALAKLAAFKGKLFEWQRYQVLMDKLVAEGYLFLHTLANAAAGRINNKVLYNARSSLGPISSEYNKTHYQRYADYQYENGRLIIDVPTAVPQTVRELGAPDRPKRHPRLPFKVRGTKPLTEEQIAMREKSATYSDYCNETRPKATGPLLAEMNS